jgi:hypothetical protein
MSAIRNRLCRFSVVAAGFVLLSTASSLGQNMSVPCSAFARNAHGGWKVLAPVMLEVGGRPIGPLVGTTFLAGSIANGIRMSEVLDRECGNR